MGFVVACRPLRLNPHPPPPLPVTAASNAFRLEPPFAYLGFVRFMQGAVLSSVGKVLAKTDSFDIETHEACDWVRLFKSKKARPQQHHLENK